MYTTYNTSCSIWLLLPLTILRLAATCVTYNTVHTAITIQYDHLHYLQCNTIAHVAYNTYTLNHLHCNMITDATHDNNTYPTYTACNVIWLLMLVTIFSPLMSRIFALLYYYSVMIETQLFSCSLLQVKKCCQGFWGQDCQCRLPCFLPDMLVKVRCILQGHQHNMSIKWFDYVTVLAKWQEVINQVVLIKLGQQ